MCGIYGLINFAGRSECDAPILEDMGRRLEHRGPDGREVVGDERASLGVRLLRIQDRTGPVTQPFRHDATGVIVACNGEIYNTVALRNRYRHYPFRSHSDIEPLVPWYLDRGAEAVAELDGMFALAIWDPRDATLHLARDRAGEKPLCYAHTGDTWLFASEPQALLAHPAVTRDLDRAALRDVFTLGYVLEPATLFTHIRRVEAGTVLSVRATGSDVHRYWHVARELDQTEPGHEAHALERLLEDAVRKQLSADVPVGVFTSGGVDSALLAAMARAERPELHTFTVGFEASTFDERRPAARLAHHLGTTHIDVLADDAALEQALYQVVHQVAEPITDPAVLPTLVLAQEAKRHVGVVLSGEGADELFGGYPTYLGHRWAPAFAALPAPVRRFITSAIETPPASRRKVTTGYVLARFVRHATDTPLGRHIGWFGAGLGLPPADTTKAVWSRTTGDMRDRCMHFDYLTYLRDGLLPKIDRATMLVSLEARAPFLDPQVTRFAWSLPVHDKIGPLTGKRLLKRAARRRLPGWTVSRRKRGLSVPVSHLMASPLATDAKRTLHDDRFAALGVLPPGRVSELVTQHASRRADHGRALWTLLVLGLWLEHWLGA